MYMLAITPFCVYLLPCAFNFDDGDDARLIISLTHRPLSCERIACSVSEF